MLRYETLILAHPQLTADELGTLESFFDKVTNDFKGKLISFDKWGKYLLTYPVKRNDYGIYILVRYDVPEDKVTKFSDEVSTFFKIKCNEIVMRHVVVKLDPKAPLNYKFPEPITTGKTGNLDSFIKENKMEGFLGKDLSLGNKQDDDMEFDNREENA